MDRQRYSRQLALSEIGEAGQERLLRASVLCVGAGGLGSPALLYLAAAGVGRLGIADFDRVDLSNLQRQVLFSSVQIGQAKCSAARERLLALNPDIDIEEFPDGIHSENAEELIGAYDVIIDGTDNFAAKFLINDACVKFGKPVVYAAINQFEGQVSVFDSTRGDAPCYRCLYPNPPTQRVMNCAEAGIIGAVAGMMGVTQAAQAIMLLAPHENFEPLVGKLWTIDTRNMRTNLLDISKNPSCPVCSKVREDIVLSYQAPQCSIIAELDILELKKDTGILEHAHLLDVREQSEWDCGHIDGAKHFALSRLMDGDMPDFDQEQSLFLYCKMGVRSMQAAQIMQQHGYQNITNLSGGYDTWIDGCG